MTETQSPRNGSDLCLPCGLCCDGSLFGHAHVRQDNKRDDDIAIVNKLGLTYQQHNGKDSFLLPCHHFKNGCCSVYDQARPSVCGGFKCSLLIQYEQGKIELEHGLEQVHKAQKMAKDLVRLMPHDTDKRLTMKNLRQIAAQLSANSAEIRILNQRFLIQYAQYEMFLRSNFYLHSWKDKNNIKEMR